jgi:hypothetical protein
LSIPTAIPLVSGTAIPRVSGTATIPSATVTIPLKSSHTSRTPTLDKLPHNLVQFFPYTDTCVPISFLGTLENVLVAMDIPEHLWTKVLLRQTQSLESATWIKSHLLGMPWFEARLAFLAHFQNQDWERSYFVQYEHLRQNSSERVPAYNERFHALVSILSIQESKELVLHYLSGLHSSTGKRSLKLGMPSRFNLH